MRIAVVGGGVFGCTTAIELAAEHDVTLYERHPGILLGATRANQGRIHCGYHYPRDPHAGELATRAAEFEARFPAAVVDGGAHLYLVAEDSRVDADAYRQFVRAAGLPWRPAVSAVVRSGAVTACISVPEGFVAVEALRATLRRELRAAGVELVLGMDIGIDGLAERHDFVVDATYGRHWPEPLQYEVCETVLVDLGPRFARQGFVVMDGDYISLDPHGRHHMLYDVRHSVHAVNTVPGHLAPLIDRGLVYTVHSHMEAMLTTARRFLTGVDRPVYRGSYFTVRAVLPDDGTDSRPTLVRADGNVVRILAGKLVAAPWAARQVANAVTGGAGPVLISVITPTWQRHKLLMERCVASVYSQTWPQVEHVIVSDGPDRDLAAVLAQDLWRRPLKSRPLVFDQLSEHDSAGPIDYGSRARNRGLALAAGDLIAYLDDDNVFRPDHLRLLAAAIEASGADFGYSRMLRHPTGDEIGVEPPQYGGLDTSLLMHRRGVPEKYGLWPLPDELGADKHAPDWGVVERWLAAGATWVHVPAITVDYYFQ